MKKNMGIQDTVLQNIKEDNIIIGRNAVLEALKGGRSIEKILIAKGTEGSIKKIEALAREKKVQLHYEGRSILDRIVKDTNHQGVIAYTAAYEYAQTKDVFGLAEERGEDPFVIICDGIEDPHNLGAIIRSAECSGAHGVIIGSRRSAGLTEVAVKASAGAIEYLPCVKVVNIARTIDELKKKGLWIAACDMDGELYSEMDMKGPIALVIGSEGKGISRLVKEKCDFTVSIPLLGNINSLNASNAAAVLMYEVRRQRNEGFR